MSNENILFVLSQNPHIIEAVKSSKFINLFRQTVFVEKELYNSNINIPQPIELGSRVINAININTFLGNLQNHEMLKNLDKENIFVLSIQNFLQKITDISNNQETVEIVDMVNVHFLHNNICSYAIGSPAKFPQIYFEELKSVSKLLGEKQENSDNITVFGYDKTLGSLFAELKNFDEENWCKEFNTFDRTTQVRNVLNSINFTQMIMSKMENNESNNESNNAFLDMSKVLADNTYKLLLKDSLYNVFNNFKSKTNINIDYVVGIEGDGFILGTLLSEILNVPFVPARKDTESLSETFDYDSYKIQQNLIKFNKNILVVDDIIQDGQVQKNIHSLLNFFLPNLTLFFGLGLNKNNLEKIKENMDNLSNNIITL
jgi:adenine/guanine phosphoribosyltransferase-like PRPP-binding protein